MAGELRFDALRAVLALVPYARTPKLHQQLLGRLRELGMLDRDPAGVDLVERFCAIARWDGPTLGPVGRKRVRAGGLFGALGWPIFARPGGYRRFVLTKPSRIEYNKTCVISGRNPRALRPKGGALSGHRLNRRN